LGALLAARGIVKRFPGVVALDGVDFEVFAGRVHALVGENGSGKSTLAKILSGQERPDAGVIEVDGTPVANLTASGRALELGIAAVSQELTLAPTLSIAENVLMGRLPRRGRRTISWRDVRAQARLALDELGIEVDERRRVGDLSTELQQEVEVARAIATRPRVLFLDEATSSLSEPAARRLLAKVEQLRQEGVAIVFISHRLAEVFACARAATVLRDGAVVSTETLADVDEDDLIRRMVGREISDLFPAGRRALGRPALEVRDLSTHDRSVVSASFDVRAGEVVGVAGLVGCGKSELALALAGATPATGEVSVDGERVDIGTPRRALSAGVRFVPEDRKRAALFPTLSVRRNLAAGWLSERGRLGVVRRRAERQRAAAAARDYGIRVNSLEAPVTQLSGGNQQKIVFARGAARGGRVFVLAEPTRGVDVGAKAQLYKIIGELAGSGAAVLVVSSELPELLGLCDRILVMYRGEIRAQFDGPDATEERIAQAALGAGSYGVAA
jgi:ABC-type sugar transport system ATPase subunit